MHTSDLTPWQHAHQYTRDRSGSQRGTAVVVGLTLVTMVAEIVAGWVFGSMALLADGWHMGTHAAALSITLAAYIISRRHAADSRYAFGTWKVEILGAYTSAVLLGIAAIYMVGASAERLLHPVAIRYDQALIVAIAGLVVNVACAFILNAGAAADHADHHSHDHAHGQHTHHDDLNLRAAYLHVVADALTSLLAIAALVGARSTGTRWLDPVIGMLGAAMILRWCLGLLRQTSAVLLDREMHHPVYGEIRDAIQDDDARVSDMHVWRVAENKFAAVVTLVAAVPRDVAEYRRRLEGIHELAHVTVEVARCDDPRHRAT